MEFRIETRALQELAKALRESGKGVKPMATQMVRGTFDKLISAARYRADLKGGATGGLIKGIKLLEFNGFDSPTKVIGRYGATEDSVKHTPGAYIRGTMSDNNSYAFYVEVGRAQGTKPPPAKDIARWLSQRHFQFYYMKKGKREYTEFRNLPTRSQYFVAKAMAQAIAAKGIPGRHFMFKDKAMTMHPEDIDIIDFDLNHLADRVAAKLAGTEGAD